MSATISQLACFTAVRHHSKLQVLRKPTLVRSKFSVSTSLEGSDADGFSLRSMPNLFNATAYIPRSSSRDTSETYPLTEEPVGDKVGVNGPVVEPALEEKKRAAKIHDFCFGIPFGGFVLAGGLIGYIFSKNAASLTTNVLFGGGLLALSTTSLKVWRKGTSCLPFILGQAVLAAALCWTNFKTYSLTKQLIPSGLYASFSAAMLCFYSYVLISGGNPPPKKLKAGADNASY